MGAVTFVTVSGGLRAFDGTYEEMIPAMLQYRNTLADLSLKEDRIGVTIADCDDPRFSHDAPS